MATELLDAAGVDDFNVDVKRILADGGPGWCSEIDSPPSQFGIRKRTNGVLVLDQETANASVREDGQIDVLNAHDWNGRKHEATKLAPDSVRIPLITNRNYLGLVETSTPCVSVEGQVSEGETVATPDPNGISNSQHASINGTVKEISDSHLLIQRD